MHVDQSIVHQSSTFLFLIELIYMKDSFGKDITCENFIHQMNKNTVCYNTYFVQDGVSITKLLSWVNCLCKCWGTENVDVVFDTSYWQLKCLLWNIIFYLVGNGNSTRNLFTLYLKVYLHGVRNFPIWFLFLHKNIHI